MAERILLLLLKSSELTPSSDGGAVSDDRVDWPILAKKLDTAHYSLLLLLPESNRILGRVNHS